ncbi:MAG: SpaH/EbpB family LPXTG-anchored major pilin [Corynebacterium sp.]|uniref:SpaH/EbpB family LPXTG-anchored major pilin n=1 Tax=Corynebacterium sp. TaxID=1720 RepID=UPI0026DEF8C8|nr:SpaH/EbpB family LPXTG-anchored major pilin [Corynebacterium sp.]MDO5670427.1 SpaH/EbpB family LPXTG-anchored major pilin [Corynebacterium sp.]
MSYTKSRRLATVAAATIAIAGLGLGTAPMAMSATAPTNLSAVTITEDTGTLTIHKYEGPTVGENPDGEMLQPGDENLPADAQRLAGATFTIYRVTDVDLKTNAGWEAAKAYYAQGTVPPADANMEQVATVTSSATGGVTTPALPVGLYYVVETAPPTTEDGTTYTAAVPFYVTLPMTNAENNAWNYNVHVYPKNDKVTKPHKAVLDGNTGVENQDAPEVGDNLTYRVSADIPNYGDVVGTPDANGYTGPDGVVDHNDLNMLWVGDSFNDHVEFQSVAGVRVGVTGDPTTSTDGTLLTAGVDYTVTTNAAGMTIVMLTDAGLDKAAPLGGSKIVVDFVTEVTSVPDSGEIKNQAVVWPGSKPSAGDNVPTPDPENPPPPPGDPTNEVVSKFGKIRINKVGVTGTGDETEPLAGATFEVYRAVGQTEGATTESGSCAPADLQGQTPLETIVSDADGNAVTSKFLRLSSWYNDGVEQSATGNNDGYLDGAQYANKYGWQNYCLVEIVSPEGYQLLAEPVKFSLTEAGTSTDNTAWTWTTVTNQADNIENELPLTGGQGLALLSLAGLVLVGGGVAYYTMSSRREDKATA